MDRVLVTGHSGFTGRHLVDHLRSIGGEVSGFDRSDGGDIRDSAALDRVLRATRPTVVYHLAGVLKSEDPQEFYSVNVLGTVALLDALVQLGWRTRVVIVSSSAVYGRTRSGGRVSERAPLRPRTHYGASKLAQEQVGMRYVNARLLPVVRARPFNLLGPGLPTSLAAGAFVDSIARLERTPAPPSLRTGNLTPIRDFVDVRDAVRAYRLIAERGRSGAAYNVSSGTGVSIQRCLDVLLGLATRPIRSELDAAKIQTDDVDAQVGDFGRLHALTAWKPAIRLERSLSDMLEHRRRTA